jgi:peptidoglycan/LPS O-acetylase OafA/YrhL
MADYEPSTGFLTTITTTFYIIIKFMGSARFFLALMVVIFHAGFSGYGGVYALYGFYLISGYVIYKSINQNYINKENWVFRFYFKRILRLLPSFLIASIIMYFALLSICNFSLFDQCQSIPDNLTKYITSKNFNLNDFFQGIYPNTVIKKNPPQVVSFFGFISPFWTVSLEIIFYLLIPIIFLFNNKKIIIAMLFINLFIYIFYSFWLVEKNDIGRWMDIVYRNFLPTLLFFNLGAVIYETKTIKLNYLISDFLLKFYRLFFLIGLIGVMLLSLNFYYSNYFVLQHNFYLFIVVFLTIVVIYIDKYNNYSSNKLDFFLGELSYPIYLNHMVVITVWGVYEEFLSTRFNQLLVIFKIPIIVFLSILLSIIFYCLIDKNINKIRKLI